MHSAPAVSYPVGRSSMRTLLYVLPALLAVLACGAWVWQSVSPDTVRIAVLCLGGLVLLLAVREALRPPQGQLVWDGQCWRWDVASGAQMGEVHARLDVQAHLLLEFRPMQGRGIWLWLERGMAPQSWDDLRRAVYALPADRPPIPVAQEEPS